MWTAGRDLIPALCAAPFHLKKMISMSEQESYRDNPFPHRHLLGIEGLHPHEILGLLDRAEEAVEISRQVHKRKHVLQGRTQINLFFEASTRTQSSFELAGKRLGADVMNMAVSQSSVKKGETLIDTAATLNAMHPDLLVVRHHAAGAVHLLARKVGCAVVNAGDGPHEHPTQALLDALTIRRHKGKIARLTVAICGDIAHSRVARSNIILLNALGARVRVIAPRVGGVQVGGAQRQEADAVGGVVDPVDDEKRLRLGLSRFRNHACLLHWAQRAVSPPWRARAPGCICTQGGEAGRDVVRVRTSCQSTHVRDGCVTQATFHRRKVFRGRTIWPSVGARRPIAPA